MVSQVCSSVPFSCLTSPACLHPGRRGGAGVRGSFLFPTPPGSPAGGACGPSTFLHSALRGLSPPAEPACPPSGSQTSGLHCGSLSLLWGGETATPSCQRPPASGRTQAGVPAARAGPARSSSGSPPRPRLHHPRRPCTGSGGFAAEPSVGSGVGRAWTGCCGLEGGAGAGEQRVWVGAPGSFPWPWGRPGTSAFTASSLRRPRGLPAGDESSGGADTLASAAVPLQVNGGL